MHTSKPNAPDIKSISSGVNQFGQRDHNERLILTLIQRHQSLPGAEIARRTDLSAQTVSVILRKLQQDGLVVRDEPQRGKVGKPSVPMSLASTGVFSIGVKIGRRTCKLVLMDFVGDIHEELSSTYDFPTPEKVIHCLKRGLKKLTRAAPASDRLAGVGIAAPYELWKWLDTVNAPSEKMSEWRTFDFASTIAKFSSLPVYVGNDATVAASAEHTFGRGREFSDYAYFFIDSFVGGGVVLDNRIFSGRTGNAAAFGTLPIGNTRDKDHQLIHHASVFRLEQQLEEAGINPEQIWTDPVDWRGFDTILETWLEKTADSLATAAVAVSAVIDFEAIMIDGIFPSTVRDQLVAKVNAQVNAMDTRGISLPRVIAGSIGGNAGAIGAACQPVVSHYFLN